MHEKQNSSISRAILHALPLSILALDASDTIILANATASRLLSTPRDHLEGGSLSRFIPDGFQITSNSHAIIFNGINGPQELNAISKELIVDDTIIRVILLRPLAHKHDASITSFVTGLSTSPNDPLKYVCNALVELGITRHACIRKTTATQCETLTSTADSDDVFIQSPTIARTISQDEIAHVELTIVPDSSRGLTTEDLSIVDMFVSLLKMGADVSETQSDASGSETALALALKAGDMGMCFFDTKSGDCYLSDRLATWCSINVETFSGTLDAWLETFREDDKSRISSLFSELSEHKKFKTVVNIHTLEQDLRLELFGRPLHENSSNEWVAIVRPFRDEQEVEVAWQTRIAMEEAARIDAETGLETFEAGLVGTLLPTTSDVSIIHSRQDAGTWHIVRPLDSRTCVYAVGSVTARNRSQAIIDGTITATIADVLASQALNVEEYVEMVRDHCRARDIETTIASVKVIDGTIAAATHAGASVYISGKSFVGTETIETTTALSLSTHSQATPESIDVAANGRPWRIMSTVVEVLSIIDPPEFFKDSDNDDFVSKQDDDEESAIEDIQSEDLGKITGSTSQKNNHAEPNNVSQFRSGSISPS